MAPVRGQQLVELIHRLRRKLGEFAAGGDDGIGGKHSGAPGIGDDGEAWSLGAGLLGKNLGHVEQVGDGVDAEHATTEKGRIQHLVAAGERSRVRGGSMGGGFGASGFDHDDWLGERNFARRRQERASISDGLHVHDDGVRPRIAAQVVDQVSPTHVQHGADRNEGTEPNQFLLCPVENRGAQSTTLTDERHIARPRQMMRSESCVEAGNRIHDAEAIRTDDAHSTVAELGQDLTFQFFAVVAVFFESRRDHDGAFDARRYALCDDSGYGFCRSGDDGEIDLFRDLLHRRVGLDAEHITALFADRVDGAAEGAAEQAP